MTTSRIRPKKSNTPGYSSSDSPSSDSKSKSSNGIGGGVVANVYPIQAMINRHIPTASSADTWTVNHAHGDMNNNQKYITIPARLPTRIAPPRTLSSAIEHHILKHTHHI